MQKLTKRAMGAAAMAWQSLRPKLSVDVGGRSVDVSSDTSATRGLIYWQPDWKTQLIGRLLTARPGRFADVGANIGQTLLDYLASPTRNGYVGFEPSAMCVFHIQSIIERNQLTDCTVLPVALSDDTTVVQLYSDGHSSPGASILADLRPQHRGTPSTIACVQFDSLAVSGVFDHLTVRKIDVEGAELLALRGMQETLKREQPWILCEVLRRDQAADEAPYKKRMVSTYAFAKDNGYEVWAIAKSRDSLAVAGFEKVASFPLDAFGPDNAAQNDYLFLPFGTDPHSI